MILNLESTWGNQMNRNPKFLALAPLDPLSQINNNPTINSPTSALFGAAHWAQLNPWLLEGQANDRRPMLITAGDSTASASVRRSATRRSHQVNYKAWSKERHD